MFSHSGSQVAAFGSKSSDCAGTAVTFPQHYATRFWNTWHHFYSTWRVTFAIFPASMKTNCEDWLFILVIGEMRKWLLGLWPWPCYKISGPYYIFICIIATYRSLIISNHIIIQTRQWKQLASISIISDLLNCLSIHITLYHIIKSNVIVKSYLVSQTLTMIKSPYTVRRRTVTKLPHVGSVTHKHQT